MVVFIYWFSYILPISLYNHILTYHNYTKLYFNNLNINIENIKDTISQFIDQVLHINSQNGIYIKQDIYYMNESIIKNYKSYHHI